VAPTHAGQHHLILHARDAQGCGNNAFALVFQKRKDYSHHSQRIHLDAAPCRMCHFYQYITTNPLICIKENAAAGKHVQHLVGNSGYCRIHRTQQKSKKKQKRQRLQQPAVRSSLNR
jgi:hypothetical protein